MNEDHQKATEKTYRAIGRFIFEFSQAEYAIRYYLGEELDLDEKHFSAVVESYDVGLLCTVTKEVFSNTRGAKDAATIKDLVNRFFDLNIIRNQVAHGLWVPFKEGGTLHYVSRGKLTPIRLENQAEALEKLATDTSQLRAKLERAFAG
jgi:hypothetical protein